MVVLDLWLLIFGTCVSLGLCVFSGLWVVLGLCVFLGLYACFRFVCSVCRVCVFPRVCMVASGLCVCFDFLNLLPGMYNSLELISVCACCCVCLGLCLLLFEYVFKGRKFLRVFLCSLCVSWELYVVLCCTCLCFLCFLGFRFPCVLAGVYVCSGVVSGRAWVCVRVCVRVLCGWSGVIEC